MNLTKPFLFVVSGVFLIAGAAYLLFPADLAGLVQIPLGSPVAIIEIQGFYGGQMIGLGLFTLLGALRPQYAIAALYLIAADLGGTALGRAIGMGGAGQFPVEMLVLMAVESGSAVVAVILAKRR